MSWYQAEPLTALRLIGELPNVESVIDIGGGTSLLAARLVAAGIPRVAVLDISQAAIERGKARAGDVAKQIEWIACDVTQVESVGTFDVWHDRAAFHFLTRPEDRERYRELAESTVRPGGHLVVGTLASDGPTQCSGLDVVRYDEGALAAEFGPTFSLVNQFLESHETPTGKTQNFLFAIFARRP